MARKRRPSSTSTLQPRVARHVEVLVGDVDDLGVELDDVDPRRREVAPGPLRRRAAAEADVEDPARARPVGERQLQVVGVLEARPVRVVLVHAALEGAVEAEVAGVVVLDDRDPVVLRVLRVQDRVAGLRVLERADPLLVALLPVDRRPVPQLRGGDGAALVRRQRDDRAEARDRQRERDAPASTQPLDERDRGGREHQRHGGRGEHLVGAELGDQPERRRERARDRAGRRDREEPPGGPSELVERVRLQPHGDRRDGAEDHALARRRGRSSRAAGSAAGPGSQATSLSSTQSSTKGIASTSSDADASIATSSRGVG